MSRHLTEYRVMLPTWDVWEIWLHAPSPEAAEADAQRLFSEGREDEFRHRACGFEPAEVTTDDNGDGQ